VARIVVNGEPRQTPPGADPTLLDFLREQLGLTGAKPACGEGACGACTVLVDGRVRRSCGVAAAEVDGSAVTTVEGLSPAGSLHRVARAFLDAGAMQCGYCTPGMVLAAAALLDATSPSEADIRAALDGNICRCGVYQRIVDAVQRAAAMPEGATAPDTAGDAAALPEAAPPHAPWDLSGDADRTWFDVLGDGLVVVLPPGAGPTRRQRPPGIWMHNGGAWLHVGATGTVTAFTGKVDVGQDNRTELSLMLAEELRVPLPSVRLVMGDTDVSPYDMGTWGSRTTPDAAEDLRITAASARVHLCALAAAEWGCAADALEAAEGAVRERGGTRRVDYATLVAGDRRVEQADGDAPVTAYAEWRTAGTRVPSIGRSDAVTGARRFVSDISRPGMLYGAVLRPPSAGARLRSVDAGAAESTDGVTVVAEGDLVAALAPSRALAREAVSRLRVEWDLPTRPSEAGLVEHLRTHRAEAEGWEGPVHDERGDVEAALRRAAVRLEATYTTAYIAHAPMETRCALAEWDGDRLTVLVGTQQPFEVRAHLARELDLDETDVRVVVPPTGGGFGGKHAADVATEAARLARAARRPVKVHWTREEEFRHAYYRPFAVVDVRSGVDAAGRLVAWHHRNVNSGPRSLECPYDVADTLHEYVPAASPLPQGPYRALSATANTFARESHVDELARRLDADPLQFRLRHLGGNPRLAAVLQAAAERIGWEESPRAAGEAYGIACGGEKGSYVATCVAVRVDGERRVQVTRLVTAFDCGAVVHPEGVTSQVQGATVMGIGGALFEAVHFDDSGRIRNAAFSAYRVPRFTDVPPVEVVLLDRRDAPAVGAGETPIIAVAPACASAIAAATGVRLRALPLVPDGVVPAGG